MSPFHSDPQPVSLSKVEKDCHHRSVDLWLIADGGRSADALKRGADYTDHHPDLQYSYYLQSIEDFGNVPLSPGLEWEHSSGLKEGDPSQSICGLDFGRSFHDSPRCRHEKAGSDRNVGSAEVHHKDFAGRWRNSALEDFVVRGNSLAGMEVNIHLHLRKISSQRQVMCVVPTLAAHDIAVVDLPTHLDPG